MRVLALIIVALYALGPRLIGHGCGNPPSVAGFTYSGPRFAYEEDDFLGECQSIHRIGE